MPNSNTGDQRRYRNEELVLQVSGNVDLGHAHLDRYEAFIDALCGPREYQKEAIRVILRYFLGRRYQNLRQLAEENFHSNPMLRDRHGAFHALERRLHLPAQLSCSVDLATATGKSYVMYAIARLMLADGIVDRVLVLCPSRTIEAGLTRKFRRLSADLDLRALLPDDARIRNPHIISAAESIIDGTVCIENWHAALERVGSSIRPSLIGKGESTLVLNDEVHHVYNHSDRTLGRWKEFLLAPEFGFRFIAGFSGTCYLDNDYFDDVIYRYSLRQAIEAGYAKSVDYVTEDISGSQDERFQKIYDNHIQNRSYRYRKVKPLTVFVTRDISACKRLTDDLVAFLSRQEDITTEEASGKVLIVTSSAEHRINVRRLGDVDRADSSVEWITSVSMLTEGWDVQNVFQIVPHEERAFNSKLLIAQVLGRGLRVPDQYRGERPAVTVFNHDAWSSRIKHLVDEVMEIEKRVCSYPVDKDLDLHFAIHQINYDKVQEVEQFQQTGEYEFTKGFVTLASQAAALERETTYARATTGQLRSKKTLVHYSMHSVESVAEHIRSKLRAIDLEDGASYAEKYDLPWLLTLIRESLQRVGSRPGTGHQEGSRLLTLIRESLQRVGEKNDAVSEENRQRLQQAFGVIHRKSALTTRYRMKPAAVEMVSTRNRPRNSSGLTSIRRGEVTVIYDEDASRWSDDDTRAVLNEMVEDESLPRSALHEVKNGRTFKTPLNLVLADHRPERDFVRQLISDDNASSITAWVKSTDQDFYGIEYSWKVGEHSKRAVFNPDFFILTDGHVTVVEIKSDEEAVDITEENRGKFRAARTHFELLNSLQRDLLYCFHFLTPRDFGVFFKFLRDANYNFVSEMDAKLSRLVSE